MWEFSFDRWLVLVAPEQYPYLAAFFKIPAFSLAQFTVSQFGALLEIGFLTQSFLLTNLYSFCRLGYFGTSGVYLYIGITSLCL